MTSLRRIMVTGLVAALGGGSAVALTACSDDDILGNGDDGKVSVSLTERELDPARAEVDAGAIEFEVKNDGDRVHEFAVETPDGVERTDSIDPGDTKSLTVDLPEGRYRMYDPRGGYRTRGVSGQVVVSSDDTQTITERTVERTVIDEEPDVPESDDPEIQDPEVQEPPPAPAAPAAPPTVTQTVVAPPPPVETTP